MHRISFTLIYFILFYFSIFFAEFGDPAATEWTHLRANLGVRGGTIWKSCCGNQDLSFDTSFVWVIKRYVQFLRNIRHPVQYLSNSSIKLSSSTSLSLNEQESNDIDTQCAFFSGIRPGFRILFLLYSIMT